MDQADRLRTMAHGSTTGGGPRIISVTSGKGGVGKTNIAVNLAILMAKRGLNTLLVDADLGLANANLIMGCRVEKTMDDVLFGSSQWSDVFVRTAGGFDLLPSSSGMRKLVELDPFSQRALFDGLFAAMDGYDIVVYDTAPGLGSHVLDFNASAHDIVIVAHPEPTALADAYALIKVLATERKEKRFKLVINRTRSGQEGLDSYRRVTEVSDEFLNVSLDYLGALPEDSAVHRAVKCQKPVMLQEPFAPFALGIERLGDKLLAATAASSARKTWNTGLAPRSAVGGQ
ncbi:MAG: MinD/ParA family protein [Bdellovibrionales bacterium]|nr:MinD/ParA family protein [Bdellovibrionales bacterium]